jgi:O-acetyl-ADP-ribose deacetylase (regulator of RNase III)
MAKRVEIDVWEGNIADLEVDALVLPTNESLRMTTPVALEVKERGGDEIERAAIAQGPIPAGSAVATPGGALPAAYVIHAVAVGHDLKPRPERLRSAARAALAFATPLDLRRMAFADLGTERGVFTPDVAAAALVGAVWAHATTSPLPERVVFVTRGADEARAFTHAIGVVRAAAR